MVAAFAEAAAGQGSVKAGITRFRQATAGRQRISRIKTNPPTERKPRSNYVGKAPAQKVEIFSNRRKQRQRRSSAIRSDRNLSSFASLSSVNNKRDAAGDYSNGRGAGVGRCFGVGASLGVGVGLGVGVTVAVGVAVAVALAVGVGVAVGPDCAQYLPPVFEPEPPQTIISLPVQTAV